MASEESNEENTVGEVYVDKIGDKNWKLEVLFEFDTKEEAIATMEAIATIEPVGLFAMHVSEWLDDDEEVDE